MKVEINQTINKIEIETKGGIDLVPTITNVEVKDNINPIELGVKDSIEITDNVMPIEIYKCKCVCPPREILIARVFFPNNTPPNGAIQDIYNSLSSSYSFEKLVIPSEYYRITINNPNKIINSITYTSMGNSQPLGTYRLNSLNSVEFRIQNAFGIEGIIMIEVVNII